MKTTSISRRGALTAASLVASVGLIAPYASAQLLAVESFDSPELSVAPGVPAGDGTGLGIITATGFGFENWQVTNKGVAGDSRFVTGGLSYPGNYDGGLSASGGSAVIDATSGGNATHSLKFTSVANGSGDVQDQIAGASVYYFSFLAERTGLTSTSTADPVNETALYPRNFGIRYLTATGNSNSNSNLGTVGSAGSWSASTDTWGQWGAKDTNGLSSSENIANGTDLIVVGVNNTGAGSAISIWTNPDSSTTSADIFFQLTDGAPIELDLTGIGTEAGGVSGDRQASVFNLDEIRVGLDAGSTIGLSNLVAAVPEPSMLGALFGLLSLGFIAVRRRR